MQYNKQYGVWNIDSMNRYCNDANNGYTILDCKWVNKLYQKQLWSFVQCSNKNHDPYWVWWNNFIHEYYCKECHYEKTNREFWDVDKADNFFKQNGYYLIDKNSWKNVDKYVFCKDKYGFILQVSITNLKAKLKLHNHFPSPFRYNPYALENIKLFCKLFRPDYDIISKEYIKIKSKYEWIYKGIGLPNNINPIFIQSADAIINSGVSHPYFFKSNGNLIFENELIKNNIDYQLEKTFKGCKDKKLLRFDFYIPLLNEVIEIDGIQHEKIINYFGGESSYKGCVKRDNIKNEFCNSNEIIITRIPYNASKIKEFKLLVDNKINDILTIIENGKLSILDQQLSPYFQKKAA